MIVMKTYLRFIETEKIPTQNWKFVIIPENQTTNREIVQGHTKD